MFFSLAFTFAGTGLIASAQKSVGGNVASSDAGGNVSTSPTSVPANNSAGNVAPTSVDINKSTFKLLICDGPPLPSNVSLPKPDYVPCDFKGLMAQTQHFINIAMVLGVLSALVLFTWAGALYVSGQPKNIDQAKAIFPAVVKGFIIMLLAWFIVYQILEWLTGSKSFGVLLG